MLHKYLKWGSVALALFTLLPFNVNASTGYQAMKGITSVHSGMSSHVFVIQEDESVWAWGENLSGQLGNGFYNVNALSPARVTSVSNARQFSSGANTTVALKNDGTVWAWGSKEYGRLGTGKKEEGRALSPEQVADLKDIEQVSTSVNHSLALQRDGTVWAWGKNDVGQLADKALEVSYKPVKIAGLTDVVAVSAGTFHSLALKKDGSVWYWGLYELKNDFEKIIQPRLVEGLTSIKSIYAGERSSLALTEDGTVWAWGYNFGHMQPKQVANLSGVIQISAGGESYIALKKDGSVWAWGGNDFGQLGNDTGTGSSIPKRINGIMDVTQIASGKNSHYALTRERLLWSWGNNDYGQLGIGSTESSKSFPAKIHKPVTVALNDQTVPLPLPPVIVNGSCLVPVRGVFEKLGAQVSWDYKMRTVLITKHDLSIRLVVNSSVATINNRSVVLTQSAQIISDSVVVPLRFISETLGANVIWNQEEYRVSIRYAE
jgi:alpha-tubulin suppressor-like RCC1 family protein